MRRHISYLFLQLKSALRLLPKLLLGSIVFAFLAFCIGYAGVKSLGSGNHLFFKVAAILPENDALVSIGFNMLTGMDSLKDYCEFITTDEASAKKMLEQGEIYAIVYIPEGFVEDVLSGRNTPAKIILPDNPGIETVIFRSVLNAGSATLAYVQSGIYAMTDAYIEFDMSDRIASASDKMNDDYIHFVLNRSAIYDSHTVSSTGSLSRTQFYICSGIILVMLFSGFLLGGFSMQEENGLSVMLLRFGINRLYSGFCRTLAVSLVYSCIFIAALAFMHLITPINILCLFLGTAVCISYIFMIYTIAGNGLYGMLLLFCTNVVMAYCSGLITPPAYLPKAAAFAGKLLPAGYVRDMLTVLFTGTFRPSAFVSCIFFTLLFIAVSALCSTIREMRNRK